MSHTPASLVTRVLIAAVRVYQWTVSPWMAGCCRFVPSCSEYALLALERHGPWKGTYLSVGRVLRCQPFRAGGVDLP